MLKRASIFLIGALFAFTSIIFIEPAKAAACNPTSSTNGNSVVLKFTSIGSCTWDVPSGITSISILIVAGGGGGGGDAAGGGGAGGVYINSSLAVTPSTTKTIQVGAGGTGGQCSSGNAGECASPPLAIGGYIPPTNGGASTFDAITVPGGGKGGVYSSGSGGNGGSGGGGGAGSGAGGTATATGTFFLANPVVHRMEPEAVVEVVPAKQDQLEVPEKVVMESHLQSPVLQPFTVAVVVEEAPECVDSAETAVVAQDLSVVHTNSHKEQMRCKLLQEQQIPVVAEVEHLMAAQVAEVLAEAE